MWYIHGNYSQKVSSVLTGIEHCNSYASHCLASGGGIVCCR
jgi:hypothetical protein